MFNFWSERIRRSRRSIVSTVAFTPRITEQSVLGVIGVNYCIENNGSEHFTSQYDVMKKTPPALVVRRGQPFALDLALDRRYDARSDKMSFIFTIEDEEMPCYGLGTLVAVPLSVIEEINVQNSAWSVIIDRVCDNHLIVWVRTSSSSAVGKWNIAIDTATHNVGRKTYKHKIPFYLLFNAWCCSDSVHLEEDEARQEYVLEDAGLIWRGSHDAPHASIWLYGQYEKYILDCALHLITNIANIKKNFRDNPIAIARELPRAITEEKGVFKEFWNYKTTAGLDPFKWLGSVEILKAYYTQKCPQKPGACWVYAGVLTTLFRAIGIPCRPVTVYSAARDTKNNLMLDYFLDEHGVPIRNLNRHSIWVYHVWNEVWMRRSDLESEYSGWQVVDATPQDLPDFGNRGCGPTSVISIKNKETMKPYDSGFTVSEVSADQVYWKYSGPTEPMKLINIDWNMIGRKIFTKVAGDWVEQDIAGDYKRPKRRSFDVYPVATLLRERRTLSRYYMNRDRREIEVKIVLNQHILIGNDLLFGITLNNQSATALHLVILNVRIDSVYYTGKFHKTIKTYQVTESVEPNTTGKSTWFFLTYPDYYKYLIDQNSFVISCWATVTGQDHEFYIREIHRFSKPGIYMMASMNVYQSKEFFVIVTVRNPLPVRLKQCVLKIEGLGLEKNIFFKSTVNIEPFAKLVKSFNLVQRRTGSHVLAAKFSSDLLNDVEGYLNYNVQPKSINITEHIVE